MRSPRSCSVGLLIFAAGVPISYYAARDGVDIDLLTRGAGFGYIGSTITSLIYATFTFIFFAIEAAILASMLQACFGIPPPIGYIICARWRHSAGYPRHHLHQSRADYGRSRSGCCLQCFRSSSSP